MIAKSRRTSLRGCSGWEPVAPQPGVMVFTAQAVASHAPKMGHAQSVYQIERHSRAAPPESPHDMRRFKSPAQVQPFLSVHGRFTTCSEWRVIVSKRSILDFSGSERSPAEDGGVAC